MTPPLLVRTAGQVLLSLNHRLERLRQLGVLLRGPMAERRKRLTGLTTGPNCFSSFRLRRSGSRSSSGSAPQQHQPEPAKGSQTDGHQPRPAQLSAEQGLQPGRLGALIKLSHQRVRPIRPLPPQPTPPGRRTGGPTPGHHATALLLALHRPQGGITRCQPRPVNQTSTQA